MPTELTYLSFDAVAEGVGASQVLAYVERLAARGIGVRLHTFEKGPVAQAARDRLARAGVEWTPHRFGGHGPANGAGRVLRGAVALAGAPLVHARADLAAGSAVLARRRSWVWDVRSLWADQRIALGDLRPGSREERVVRSLEAAAARRCTGVVALTQPALDILAERHGSRLLDNAAVVPTCVDLQRFRAADQPPTDVVRLLFSGTLNRYYDVPTMLALVAAVARLRPACLDVVAPAATAWDVELAQAGVVPRRSRDVAADLAASSAGLSVCRFDAGPSLAAALPTKVAEFLATGRPVVVNAGLGDLDDVLGSRRCGVVVQAPTPDAIDAAAAELVGLLEDPATASRCRALAEQRYDVDRGVDRLVGVYERC